MFSLTPDWTWKGLKEPKRGRAPKISPLPYWQVTCYSVHTASHMHDESATQYYHQRRTYHEREENVNDVDLSVSRFGS